MTAPAPTVYIQGQGSVSADQLNTFLQGLTNVALLRTLTGVPGMQVNLLGYNSPNDGGQGGFYWSPTSLGPDNGNTIIVPTGGTLPSGLAASGAWVRLGTPIGATFTTVADINYQALFSDSYIAYKPLTAARVVTLPTSASCVPGRPLTIQDFYGLATASHTITIVPNGTDTIDGGLSPVISVPFFGYTLVPDGLSSWSFVTDTGRILTSPVISNPTITGTVAGAAIYTAPTINSPTINTPAVASPSITGTVSGSATYTRPVLTGVIDGSAAAAGVVGELFSSNVASPGSSITSTTSADITAITLQPGDWDIWGNVVIIPSAVISSFVASISTTSGTQATPPNGGAYVSFKVALTSGLTLALNTGTRAVSISTPTTYYLEVQATFTGTATAFGFIGARRRR